MEGNRTTKPTTLPRVTMNNPRMEEIITIILRYQPLQFVDPSI